MARDLAEIGYSPIPILKGHKRPGHHGRGLEKWQEREHKPFTSEEIDEVFSGGDGVGICGGGPHCLKFADVDTDDSEINAALDGVFPPCTVIKRGAKGSTRFYRAAALPAGKIMWKKDGDKQPVLELLGSGNQSVVPPSQHPDTKQPYAWIGPDALGYVAPDELAELPADFLEQVDAVLEPLGYYRPEKAKAKTYSAAEDSAGAGRRKQHRRTRPNVWRMLNDDALNRLSEWVPHVGLFHLHHKANGGYEGVADWRPSGSGKPLERRATNLKIDPQGIVDFGDSKTYTAVDIVIAAQGCTKEEAFAWLDDRLNSKTVDIESGEASIAPADDVADAPADGADDEPYELEDEEIDWDAEGELSEVELKRMRIKAKAERTALMNEFNAKYMVVLEGGQSFVYRLSYNEILGRKFYESMTIGSLSQLYANRKVTTFVTKKGQQKKKPVAPFWNTHERRHQYIEGVEFDPSRIGHRTGFLNLWQGFGVEAEAGGSWAKLKAHVLHNICSGVIDHYEWLLNWCARLVQHPELRAEIAVVLRGKKGTGKGILGHALRQLLAHHGIHISTSAHLVGKFNEHLRDCVFLFADEAFFAGDKAGESALKALITESVLLIEGKFKTAQQYPNRLHVLMASNSDWVIPAGPNERRYFVLDVSDKCMQQDAYFAAIDDELKAGGYEAMLHELMHRDISKFNHRKAPDTNALQDQKMQSLPTDLAWWQAVLQREYVYKSKLGLEDYFGEWHEWMATEVLYDSYVEFAKAKGERQIKNRVHFGRFMHDMGAQPAKSYDDVIGERLSPSIGREPELIKKVRPHGYRIGTCEQAREVFERKTGIVDDSDEG